MASQTWIQVKEEIAKCGMSTEIFDQQTEVILKAFDKVAIVIKKLCNTILTIIMSSSLFEGFCELHVCLFHWGMPWSRPSQK